MARSVLLQLARDSIQEVLEAKRTIEREALLNEHPLLGEAIPTTVKIFVGEELRGSFSSHQSSKSLLEDIIFNAKKAAFEDANTAPITTSEYLHCVIELTLETPDGVMSERDEPILKADLEQPSHHPEYNKQ